MKTLYLIFLGMFLINIHAHSQTVNARLDINQGLANGSITATTTPFDLGTINDVFDNNASTLVRTHSINPLLITLSFAAPVTMTASKIILATDGNWTVEAAATLTDLNNATGTYRKVINLKALTGNSYDSVSFTPISASYVRLTARRTVGDDFVHLNDWQLYAQQNLSSIVVKKNPFFIFKSTGTAEINPLQKVNLKLQGTTSSGVNVDVSGASWSSSNNAVATVSSAGVLTGVAAGTSNITATLFGISTTLTVRVVTDSKGSDLSVQYIKRVPEISFVENSSNPAVEGWPAVNSTVTWRAYVKSWFPVARNNVSYRWLWNGTQIATGTLNIPARGIAHVDLPRTWTFARNELTFVIDPSNAIAELTEANNQLKIYTNAISINLTVEQSLYEYFHRYQSSVGTGNTAIEKMNSYEDWAQNRHVKRWNQMFAEAIYPETPNGVLDRIRIDSIIIVPDNAIPLVPGSHPNSPNANDRTVDLQWGFPFRLSENNNFYIDTLTATDLNPFFFEGSFLHEVGHARYLIDEYGYDVNDINGSVVAIKENGAFIGGSEYLPVYFDNIIYLSQQNGLMNSTYTKIDRHSAAALNLIAGHRAVAGNSNPPGNIGIFMNDLPAENRFTLKDSQGNLLTNASVKVFQSSTVDINTKFYDGVPELSLTSDASGRVLVGRNPFQVDNHINLAPEGVLLMRVETATQVGYAFFESSWFNLAYWGGKTTLADYDLTFTHLIAKTQNGINGPSCLLSGQSNTFVLNPEFNNFNSISWWVNGDATIQQDPSDPRKVTIVMSAYNPSSVNIFAGVNYPTAPWYQSYQKQLFVNNCSPSMRIASSGDTENSIPELLKIRIVDLTGKEMLRGESYDPQSFIANTTLSSGLYLMQVSDNAGSYVVKIVK